jgi:lipopolysaccharide biosynthesis glycosyltransferase
MIGPANLLLTFTESYAGAGAVAIESALRHAPPQTSVTVGTIDLSEPSARRLSRIADRHGIELTIADVSHLAARFPRVGRYPPLTWTRTLAVEILPAGTSRAVYLDADVIVRSGIGSLWAMDLRTTGLAAVQDSMMPTHGERGSEYVAAAGSNPITPYFNTGVMVIDLQAWAALAVGDRVLEIIDQRRLPLHFVDQDALNLIFLDRWLQMEPIWNAPADETTGDPIIVQFLGGLKPWEPSASGRFVEEYHKLADVVR